LQGQLRRHFAQEAYAPPQSAKSSLPSGIDPAQEADG
jgi:hypothetical protein